MFILLTASLVKLTLIIKNKNTILLITFLVIVLTLGFVIEEQSNYIYIFGMMAILACILFQNVLLYAQTKIPGKIGTIKESNK